MTIHALSLFTSVSVALVAAQNLTPLTDRRFPYDQLPYQVTGNQGGIRGPQSGYNICNSTTEGPDSKCQTLILNSLDDFCMWSSNLPGATDTIGDGEAREVAWCTKTGHGARLIPAGAITGVQWLYAKDYIQVVGFLDQTKVGLISTDQGGELDPNGADGQGNPLGGVVYTNAFGQSAANYKLPTNNSVATTEATQVINWLDFIGGGVFCIRACNPTGPDPAGLCQHIYDLIGCNYNAIADYNNINNTFTVCDSDDMAPQGVYTDPASGKLTTWFQPQTGAVVPPYTTVIPSSSNCQTFSSAQLYGTGTATTTSTTATQTGTNGGSGSSSGSTSRSTGTQTSTSNTSSAVSLMPRGGSMALLAVGSTTVVAFISIIALLA